MTSPLSEKARRQRWRYQPELQQGPGAVGGLWREGVEWRRWWWWWWGRGSAAPGSLCCTPRCCCQLESCSSCSPKIDLIISIPSVPVFLKFFVSSPCCLLASFSRSASTPRPSEKGLLLSNSAGYTFQSARLIPCEHVGPPPPTFALTLDRSRLPRQI